MNNFNCLKLYEKEKVKNKKSIISNEYFTILRIPKNMSTSIYSSCKDLNLVKYYPCYGHEGLYFLENYIDINLPVYCIVRNPFNYIYTLFFHLIDIYINKNNINFNKNFNKSPLIRNKSLKYLFEKMINKNNNKLDILNKNIMIKGFRYFVENYIDNIYSQSSYIKSNKNIKVKYFKIEDNTFNNYILNKYNINLKLNQYNSNVNNIKKNYDIKDFFNDQYTIDLIVKSKEEDFNNFNYSKKF